MGRAGASIPEAPMVDGAGRSPCAGCTFTENAIIDPGNTVDLNGACCKIGSQRTRGQKVRERPFAPAFVCAGCYSAEIARHLDAAELTLTPRSAPNVDDPAVFCGYATVISERCVFSRPFSRFIHSFLKSYASTRKKSSVRILAFPLVRKRRKPKSFLSSPNAPSTWIERHIRR